MIYCEDAARLMREAELKPAINDGSGEEIRSREKMLAEAARHTGWAKWCIREMVEKLTDEEMFHTRHTVGLIASKLASLEKIL